MKAATVKGNSIAVEEVLQPSLSKKGAIIKAIGCGLCGSDIVKFRHNLVPDGTVLGHEVLGEIVEIDSLTDFQLGDKIVTAHHIPCFECNYCKNENFSMCQHFKETNIFPGGFAEYIYVSEEHLLNIAYKIPEHLSNEEISFYEPLGCCVRAVKRANLKPQSKVLVIGLGSIGILMGQALKAYGHDVYGSDIISNRLELADSLGVKALALDEMIEADAVFLTAGADATIEVALKQVRDGGKIVVFASTANNFGFPNNEIYYRELTVMGSYSPAPIDLKDSFELLKSGRVVVKNLSTVYELKDIEKAFHDTISNAILKAYIKVN